MAVSLRYFILSLLLAFSVNLFSINKSIRFDVLTIKNGLSQSSVNDIIQDNKGFIWIATQDGLNKYDGYSFTTYYHDDTDTTSICNNFITDLEQDSSGNLWIATELGLSLFNPKTEIFTNFTYNPAQKSGIPASPINQIILGANHLLWGVTAEGGVFSFNINTYEITNYNSIKSGLQTNNTTALLQDKNQNTWVGTSGLGLAYKTGESSTFSYPFRNLKTQIIRDIYQDVQGYLWIGTNKGLYKSNAVNPSAKTQFLKVPFIKNPHQKDGSEIIQCIYQGGDSKMWIGTEGGGLFSIKGKRNLDVKNYQYKPNSLTSLCDNIVFTIFEDKTGLMWIGTNNGLNKFDPKKQSFDHIKEGENEAFSLADNTVWSILDDDKFLWVGTRQGLNQINKTTGETTIYDNISKSSIFQNNKSVMMIYGDANGDLFIGTVDGLYQAQFNASNSLISTFIPINYQNEYFKKELVNKIYVTKKYGQDFWIGTKNGLALINLNSNKKQFFSVETGELPNNTIRDIYKDNSNNLWVATEGGICKLIKEKDNITFKTYNKLTTELNNDLVMSIWEDKKNVLWLGTYGGGLNYFNPRTEKFKAYTEKEGLSNNVVYNVLGDNLGRLWMSTNKGVSMFDPRSETFMTYHENDGLQSDEFNIGAAHKNEEGELFFGGINGLSSFHPDDVVKNPFPPQMAFTALKIDNNIVKIDTGSVLKTHLNYTKELILSYKINNFSFEFAALHFSFPEKNRYAYKMVGFDENWNHIGDQRYAHYTNLDPGEYTFIVKGSNSDGIWSDNVASLKLIITPPFWETWWFRIAVAAGILTLAFIFIKLRIKQIEAQKEALERLVEKRTAEVREQKEKIELQKAELETEKEKSEKLLLNILPEQMVDELKIQGKARARHYSQVSVMFTDFKGFTQISENTRPGDLVAKLDSYFIKFDEILEKYNIEKIKTIGDAYMCAGGIPIRNKSNPIEVVLAGLEIQRFVIEYNKIQEEKGEKGWELRIGIHTGEIIAGVIGIKRFAYDIWGDTVNVGNRMESSGEAGKVNVSGETYECIKNLFECTYRGKVQAKNKGEIDMYFVEGIKEELSVDGKGIVPNALFNDYLDLEIYSTINYKHAEKYIVKMLEDGLSPDLHYHNIEHMKDVCRSVERIAKGEGIKGKELFLLKTAALYHDAGFIHQYKDNEPIGAKMAKEALPQFGYSEEELDLVEELILATKVPQQPKTQLQQIICDADLDYLGRDDFYPISEGLKKEFMAYGIVKNDKHWDEIQIGFLSAHRYFTKTNRETRAPQKFKRIDEIKARYAADDYTA